MRNFDHDEYRMRGHRIINEPEGFGAPGMGSARCMPRGFDSPHGMPPFGGPDFDGPGFDGPNFGGPGHGMGPGHGRPPRRPDPRFLRQRLEDADLADLIDMAGRMLRRRPQGGPAQGQALILSILLGREALSQRELQQLLGIQPGSLSELLSKLEAKGLITRQKAEDRRGNLLRITDAGREAAAANLTDGAGADPFASLTAEQQDALAASLRTLLTAWVAELTEEPPRLNGQKPVKV